MPRADVRFPPKTRATPPANHGRVASFTKIISKKSLGGAHLDAISTALGFRTVDGAPREGVDFPGERLGARLGVDF